MPRGDVGTGVTDTPPVDEAPCAGVEEGTLVGVRGEGDEGYPLTDTNSSARTQTMIRVVSNVLSSRIKFFKLLARAFGRSEDCTIDES
ncbi:MAG: hypothetical protein ACXV4C_08705 [Halobacteriota archaeon]